MMSPMACILAARSNAVMAAQAAAACCAAAIAARASSRSPWGTVAITSPVAGLAVSAVAPVRAARHSPPTNISTCVLVVLIRRHSGSLDWPFGLIYNRQRRVRATERGLPMAVTDGTDSQDLAKFGYKQELDRSLGSFSSFAAGFSYISILTGVFQLFAFGFAFAGPGVWWTWWVVFSGQFAVALCFAEMAGQYPLAGSVYQWSKNIASDFTSWMAGWIMIIGAIVTVAAVAVAWQVILPQVTTWFQFIGDK